MYFALHVPLTSKVSAEGLLEALLLCGLPFGLLVWGCEEERRGEASRCSMGCPECDSSCGGLDLMVSRGINSVPFTSSTSMSTTIAGIGYRRCVCVCVWGGGGGGGEGSMHPDYYGATPCRSRVLVSRVQRKCKVD